MCRVAYTAALRVSIVARTECRTRNWAPTEDAMKIHAWNQPVSRISSVASPSLESMPPPSGAVVEERPSHVAVSQPGQLISKLTQLEQEEPDKFAEVVSGLAGSLREVAEALDGRAAKRLDKLASKLDDIAKGGDIGQLARHQHALHEHDGHHGIDGFPGEANGLLDSDGDSVPPPSADIQQVPTWAPPPLEATPASPVEDATPTRPWNPPPALLTFSRFDGHHDDADREVMSSAFASLLAQLDAALGN